MIMWSRMASRSWLTRVAAVCGGGSIGLASMFVAQHNDANVKMSSAIANWQSTGPLKLNGQLLSRRTTTDFDRTGLGLRLYQYEACPFCCKVRAFLDYYGFSYDVVEVRPLTRKEIKKLDGVSKLPAVVTGDDHKLSDSSLIISTLASYLMQKDKSLDDVIAMYPEKRFFVHSTGKEMVAHPNMYEIMSSQSNKRSHSQLELDRKEEKWRKWVDEYFIKLIVPNIYRTWSECIQMFRWFSEAGNWEKLVPAWERIASVYIGSCAMYFLSKKSRKKYDEDVRMLIIKASEDWVSALEKDPFIGGKSPNLADLAMYGTMNAFKGSQTFHDICENIHDFKGWYNRMRELVDAKAGFHLIIQRSDIKK